MNKKELNDYYNIESNKIYKYWTDINRYDNKKECLLKDSRTINQHNYRNIPLPEPKLVDIESELTNRTRKLSKCPTKKYQGDNNIKIKDINNKECEKNILENKKVTYKYCYLDKKNNIECK